MAEEQAKNLALIHVAVKHGSHAYTRKFLNAYARSVRMLQRAAKKAKRAQVSP